MNSYKYTKRLLTINEMAIIVKPQANNSRLSAGTKKKGGGESMKYFKDLLFYIPGYLLGALITLFVLSKLQLL